MQFDCVNDCARTDATVGHKIGMRDDLVKKMLRGRHFMGLNTLLVI